MRVHFLPSVVDRELSRAAPPRSHSRAGCSRSSRLRLSSTCKLLSDGGHGERARWTSYDRQEHKAKAAISNNTTPPHT